MLTYIFLNLILTMKMPTSAGALLTTFLFQLLQLVVQKRPLLFTFSPVLQNAVDVDQRSIHHDNRVASSSSSREFLSIGWALASLDTQWRRLQPCKITYDCTTRTYRSLSFLKYSYFVNNSDKPIRQRIHNEADALKDQLELLYLFLIDGN